MDRKRRHQEIGSPPILIGGRSLGKLMKDITFRIHWLSFTIHAPSEEATYIYENLYKDTFGALVSLGNGGRGFKEIQTGLNGFKIYLHPTGGDDVYFHFEIPGEACDSLRWEYYFALVNYLEANYPNKYFFKRIDLAFDDVPFTPQDVEEAIIADNIRSLAKRESLEIFNSPYKQNDNGEIGCYTVNFGSRSSERMVRVYNKRGYTRVELQTKDARAHAIGMQLLNLQDINSWFPVMISHLLDFMDLNTPWWKEFISGNGRAYLTVSEPRKAELERLAKWFDNQIAPAFSVLVDAMDGTKLQQMIKQGRKRRNAKYEDLLRIPPRGMGTP
jgi:DNA relaxase NicK